jgi:molybdenum cofactor cytidylyltransferase
MEGHDRVAGVILAAGESRRFGSPKQLALLDGRTLLEHVMERTRLAGLAPIVAVVPVWLTRPAAMTDAALVWVRNPDPERGMSHSLRLGFAALPEDVSAAMILLGDQPGVPVDHLQALVAARGPRPFVATLSRNVLQPPVLVERSHFSDVETRGGDIGLRDLLRSNRRLVTAVPAARPIADVDLPTDLPPDLPPPG